MSVIAYTSANLQYLDRALVLERTVRATNPSWHLVLVLVDALPSDPSLLSALERFDEVIVASELLGERYLPWIFMHDVVEACTAVKGAALKLLLERECGAVVYLDPDIGVFADMSPILGRLDRWDLCITPHQLVPDTDPKAVEDNELGSLRTGIFNLGFLLVKPSEEGRRFASWWSDRLSAYCIDDAARGLFTDQKWMDHAPVFFPTAGILRDPGLNVASWNLSQRRVSVSRDGGYLVNGEPLYFWHFTKATSVGPLMTLRYGAHDPAVAELWRFYLEALEAEAGDLKAPEWRYASYADGEPISLEARRLYRNRHDLQAAFRNPFASGHGSFQDWLAQQSD